MDDYTTPTQRVVLVGPNGEEIEIPPEDVEMIEQFYLLPREAQLRIFRLMEKLAQQHRRH